jgi:hypothetical protein
MVAKTLSPYGYVAGNPLNMTDPFGSSPAGNAGGGDLFPSSNPFADNYLEVVAKIQLRFDIAVAYDDAESGHVEQIQDLINGLGNIATKASDAGDTLPDWLTEYQSSLQSDLNAFTESFSSPASSPPPEGPCDDAPGPGGAVLSGCDIPGPAPEPGLGFETAPVPAWDPAFAFAADFGEGHYCKLGA